MKPLRILAIALLALAAAVPRAHADHAERAERRYIAEGNSLYNQKRYAEAEVAYNKALQENPNSAAAQFNLASSLVRQAAPGESGKELMEKARRIYQGLLAADTDADIARRAAYNLGNMAYNTENYDQAIALYKEALRRNPDDDRARDNLRMAQLKKQQQDQNQDQNQDRNQDQQQQDQDQQQQDRQNQDQQNQDRQNQDQQNQGQQKPQQQDRGGISDQNAEKILKAMENEEMATRRRVQEAEKKEKDSNARRRTIQKPW